VPSGEAHSNILSLAMVEAAIKSADEGRRILIAEVLDQAHAEAVRTESDPSLRAVLESWSSVHDVVGDRYGRPLQPSTSQEVPIHER
jgi:hypothetical protein